MKKAKYLVFILLLILAAGCGKKKETKQVEEKVKYVVTKPLEYREMNQVFRSDAVLEPQAKVDHKTEKG